MNNRTPRLATLALMLAALTACTKTNITPNDDLTNALNPSSGAPIAFETEDAFTKAVIDDINDLEVEGNKFRVWSHFQGTTSGPMFTEEGTEVEYKKLNEESIPQYGWTYSPTRYWLNGTYDFAAVYPATIPVEVNGEITQQPISGTYAPAEGGTTPILTVKDFDVTNQDDLLVAFNTGIDGGNHPSSVELNFQHALSCIQLRLNLKPEDFYEIDDETDTPILSEDHQLGYAVITKVGLRNVSTTGSLMASKESEISYDWTPSTTLGNVDFVLTGSDMVSITHSPTDCLSNGILAIPQPILGTSGELYLEVNIDFPGVINEPIRRVYNIPLDAAGEIVPIWEANKKYIYFGEIDQNFAIEFSVTTINKWEDNPLGGFNVVS